MTPEQKRIAIAKICGWKWITSDQMCGYAPWRKQYEGADIPTDGSLPFDSLPDYLSDLNAMHEAEKVLISRGGLPTYEHFLRFNEFKEDSLPWYGSVHATAAQRAEAFGLTLNLWTAND